MFRTAEVPSPGLAPPGNGARRAAGWSRRERAAPRGIESTRFPRPLHKTTAGTAVAMSVVQARRSGIRLELSGLRSAP